MQNSTGYDSFDPSDLTDAERELLEDIRRHKLTLLDEIQQLKDEIADVTAELESMDAPDERNNPKTKQMSIGRKKFNMDPKKGIEYLIENELLENTPESVAQFLYNGEGTE